MNLEVCNRTCTVLSQKIRIIEKGFEKKVFLCIVYVKSNTV